MRYYIEQAWSKSYTLPMKQPTAENEMLLPNDAVDPQPGAFKQRLTSWVYSNRFPLAMIVLGAALRLYRLSTYSIWIDEMDTFYVCLHRIHIHPPLFSTLLSLWILLGTTDTILRLFPALIGIAAIWFFWQMANEIAGRTAACYATLLFTVSPITVYYSQELRMYGLLLLVCSWSWTSLFRWLKQPGWKQLIFYVIPASLSIYTHYFAFFCLLGQGIVILLSRPTWQLFKKAVIGYLLVAVSYLPWLASFLYFFNRAASSKFWALPVTWKTPIYTWRILTSSYEPGWRLYTLLGSMIFLLTLIGLFAPRGRRVRLFFLGGFIVPQISAMGLSLILPTSFFVPRYVLFTIIPVYIAVAHALEFLPSRSLKTAILCGILALHGWILIYHYQNVFQQPADIVETRPREEFREAAYYIADRLQPGDAVGTVCESGSGPYWYYMSHLRNFPYCIQLDLDHSYEKHITEKYGMDEFIELYYPFFKATEVSTVTPQYQRLWLYGTQWNWDEDPNDYYYLQRMKITNWLKERYRVVSERKFRGIDLTLFDLKQPPASKAE